ncbi:hypothetical protein E3N88_25777 [Mikania micrantha]|uniref:Uncharacterized protein n=1 Tax=Mikania micrantha TaxID=192012 RepID=A0A5N6N8H6_9ASTR|nr:hypothetical protein E3N88_25777 [Mikania micrantha]
MADFMQGRGHGGDGAEDPPPPGGFGRGHHEADFDAPRKTRGKAKNKKLTHAVSLSGRPLTIPFDVNATFTPVGELNDWFTREVGIYMWEHIAFDKTSWKYVSSAEKNALYEHFKNKSRLEAFHNAHTGKDGTFDSEVAERHYNDLKAEFQNQIGPNSDGEFDEESSASHPNEVAVFEKVMGVRRGHTRGIGRKPSISDGSSSSFVGPTCSMRISLTAQGTKLVKFDQMNHHDEVDHI